MAGHQVNAWAPPDPLAPKWRCPHCHSTDVLIARPGWVREFRDGEREAHVEIMTDSAVIQWFCCDCQRGRSGEPDLNA